MIKKILVGMLLGITFLITTGCDKLNDLWAWDGGGLTEQEKEVQKSTNVRYKYFIGRGWNMRFVGVLGSAENIMDGGTTYQFFSDITLNIADILIVNNNDVITIANGKTHLQTSGISMTYNPVFVNCTRNTIRVHTDERTVLQDAGSHTYRGTMYFITGNGTDHLFEFEIRDGLLIASMPAQYLQGAGNATLPLRGSEVERITREGKEGVDYHLFTRDGKTLVRIANNLYERRFDTWVYYGIADPFLPTAWLRKQTSLIFEILDWDDITAPYQYFAEDGRTVIENRNNVNQGQNYYFAGPKQFGGNINDPNDITTPLLGCKR